MCKAALALLACLLPLAAFGQGVSSQVVPNIQSGFGSSPTGPTSGAESFQVIVGTGSSNSGIIHFNENAPNFWNCNGQDVTTWVASGSLTTIQVTGQDFRSVSFTNVNNAGVATNWVAGDRLQFRCHPY